MSFVTNAQVKTSVLAALHQSSVSSYWDDAISDANTAAYDQICHHFLLLGYTQAQIDAWDRGVTFNKFLARYQALIDVAGDNPHVEEWRTELDYWRGKLEEITKLVFAMEAEKVVASMQEVTA